MFERLNWSARGDMGAVVVLPLGTDVGGTAACTASDGLGTSDAIVAHARLSGGGPAAAAAAAAVAAAAGSANKVARLASWLSRMPDTERGGERVDDGAGGRAASLSEVCA